VGFAINMVNLNSLLDWMQEGDPCFIEIVREQKNTFQWAQEFSPEKNPAVIAGIY
jgi:hypothetical protein